MIKHEVVCGVCRSRGGVPPPQAVVPRGVAPRGAPPSRLPSNRGRAQRGRGAPPPVGYRPPPPVVQDSYGEYVSKWSVIEGSESAFWWWKQCVLAFVLNMSHHNGLKESSERCMISFEQCFYKQPKVDLRKTTTTTLCTWVFGLGFRKCWLSSLMRVVHEGFQSPRLWNVYYRQVKATGDVL